MSLLQAASRSSPFFFHLLSVEPLACLKEKSHLERRAAEVSPQSKKTLTVYSLCTSLWRIWLERKRGSAGSRADAEKSCVRDGENTKRLFPLSLHFPSLLIVFLRGCFGASSSSVRCPFESHFRGGGGGGPP